MPNFLFAPVPHDDAVDFIKSKPVASREVFDGLLPELKARAFVVSGLEVAGVAQRVRDRIADLPAGGDWNAIKRDVANDLSPFLVDDDHADPEERDAQIAGASRRAELLIRTHGFQAYQTAAYDVAERHKDVFPYYQYVTMEDANVRESHAALDGLVLPQDSPFWRDHYPPWDYGCRCQCVPISQGDHEEAVEKDEKREPDDRLVLDDARTRELEQSGRLVRGPNNIANVQSPVAAGKENAFSWHPGDLRITAAQLQQRYDPDIWQAFADRAKTEKLEDGGVTTVLDWLNGAPILPTGPIHFKTPELAKRWADAHIHPENLTLTPADRFALKSYQGADYHDINSALRQGGALPAVVRKQVAQLDAALAANPLPEAVRAFRGVGNGVELLPVDAGYQDAAFTSSSLSEERAGEFGTATIEFVVPAGQPGIYMNGLEPAHAHEMEILLPRNLVFRVKEKKVRNGRPHIIMEVA